uniref:Uncharacterized protein n=1 Tax=Desulfacinum infernum TaxID=35837 RepID=A0A832A2G9_9BACT
MGRRPDPLLEEFLDETLTLPELAWETVPFHVNPFVVWDTFDENVEGWVPVWYPVRDPVTGRSYGEFERAHYFHQHLVRTLAVMHRWPLWGSRRRKKHAVAIALLHIYCEVGHQECAL